MGKVVGDRLGGLWSAELPPRGWAGTFSLANPFCLHDSPMRTEVTPLDSGELEPEPASVALQPPRGICLARGGRQVELWKLVRAWEKLAGYSSLPSKQQGPKLLGCLVWQAHLPGVPAGPVLASWEEVCLLKTNPDLLFSACWALFPYSRKPAV